MTATLWTPPRDLVLPETFKGRPVELDRVVPRICHYSPYAFSSGLEAIELAASAGLVLDPWEQLVIQLGLGETAAGRWAAFQVGLLVSRQNGKGSILEALELFWLFGTGERLIGHSAHEYRTAMEAFRRVLALVENTDYLRKKVKRVMQSTGEEGMELLTGQRLRFLARSKGAGRGFTFGKLVWDEAYALTETQQEAQLPTLSAVENPQIWITSSPPLTSDTGGPLFTLRRLALAGTAGIVYLDYGCEGTLDKLDEIDLDNHDLWRQANPAETVGRITIETMQRERVSMGDAGFARERLGIWPPDLTQGFGVITKEQWERLLDPRSGSDQWQPGDFPAPDIPVDILARLKPPTLLVDRPAIGADVSPRVSGQPAASIGLAQRRADGRRHIEVIKKGTGTGWLVSSLVKLVQVTNGAIVIDPGSPAGSILGELEAALKAAGIDVDVHLIKMTVRDVAQAFGMIYDAATDTGDQPTIAHLGQSELTLAVGGAVTRNVGEGKAWAPRDSAVDITGLVAVTDAIWALDRLPDLQESVPMVMWA